MEKNENHDLTGVEILIFRPFSEYLYQYSVNGPENSRLIERENILVLINSIPISSIKVNYFIKRFMSFYIIINPPSIGELTPDLSNLQENLKDLLTEDIEKQAITPKVSRQTAFKDLGENISDFSKRFTSLFRK